MGIAPTVCLEKNIYCPHLAHGGNTRVRISEETDDYALF